MSTSPPDKVAALPYRKRNGTTEVLLVTSRTRRRWILPKGNIEPDLTPRESAALEAQEEGGVEGTLQESEIGTYEHGIPPDAERTAVYLMEVTDVLESWPEDDVRRRAWFTPDQAQRRVYEDGLRQLLRRFSSF